MAHFSELTVNSRLPTNVRPWQHRLSSRVTEQDKRSLSTDLLAKIAEELGVTIDYLVNGKGSVVADIIPAIKASPTLQLEVKNALVILVQPEGQKPTGLPVDE